MTAEEPGNGGIESKHRRKIQTLKWVAVVVICVEVLLVWTGLLDLSDAIIIAVLLEVLCGLLALALAFTARVVYRQQRQDGASRWDSFLNAIGTVLPNPVVTLLRHEIGGLISVTLLARRRNDVPDEATIIRYGATQKTFVVVMMLLGPIEIVLAELLVPWLWLRIILFALGVYGILWLLGFYSGLQTRPHYIDRDRLVLRTGHLAAVSVDVGSIRGIRRESHAKYKGFVEVADGVVAVPGMSGTALTVTLAPHTLVRIQGRGKLPAREVRFDADDVARTVRTIKDRIESAH